MKRINTKEQNRLTVHDMTSITGGNGETYWECVEDTYSFLMGQNVTTDERTTIMDDSGHSLRSTVKQNVSSSAQAV